MEWYLFTSHIFRKTFIDAFIDEMIANNGHLDSFTVYEKINGNELLTYLKTDDLKIARFFINKFVDYKSILEPQDLDLLTLKN
jgi:hypothetical protein